MDATRQGALRQVARHNQPSDRPDVLAALGLTRTKSPPAPSIVAVVTAAEAVASAHVAANEAALAAAGRRYDRALNRAAFATHVRKDRIEAAVLAVMRSRRRRP